MRAVVQCIMANRLMALRFFVNCFKSAEATELVLRQRAQILDELADSVAKARHSATPAHDSAASVSASRPDRLRALALAHLLLVSVRSLRAVRQSERKRGVQHPSPQLRSRILERAPNMYVAWRGNPTSLVAQRSGKDHRWAALQRIADRSVTGNRSNRPIR